ncbi:MULTISPECIES: hypothetical protein, partial [unclassified Bartonella]|uniref:hypothetical protein n=1 Tax=unclassified Bartonella TaxID=2645622 RepID=UPI0035CEAE6E
LDMVGIVSCLFVFCWIAISFSITDLILSGIDGKKGALFQTPLRILKHITRTQTVLLFIGTVKLIIIFFFC